MITLAEIDRILGLNAFDNSRNKIGKIGQVYVDEQTGQPEWMTVRTGLFGTRESFVPTEPAQLQNGDVLVPFAKDQVRDAPNVEPDARGHLSVQEEAQLYQYYGIPQPAAQPTGEAPAPPAGRPEEWLTRSEERMRVGKQTRESGRVHLRKYVVTEEQQQDVPLRREKVHVEHEPISKEDRDRMAGAGISEADQEVVLHEERPTVAEERVPVERVRMSKETETDQETVRGKVRKERIEAQGMPENQR